MKCASCGSVADISCGGCNKHYDYTCAGVRETTFRNYNSDKKASWRCPSCKASPLQPSPDTPSLGEILLELKDLKLQLTGLPAFFADVKAIKAELADIKKSCEFNGARVEELQDRVQKMEGSLNEMAQIRDKQSTISQEVDVLKQALEGKEQWIRQNNVEIKGIPMKANENLFTIVESLEKLVGYSFSKSQINYIARVPTYDPKEKNIILTFVNRYIKEEFVAAARAKKTIMASDIGFQSIDKRIFINDHLTPNSKKLLTKTKSFAKDKGYLYVWVKYCKIHLRKNDTSPVKVIQLESDLNKMS